ncbi:hypothetical protein Tco_0246194, partial [Tanacetum coccineum]
ELFLGEDATRAIPNMGFNLVDVEGVWKRISDKRTKNEAKNDKTEHRMEEREKPKSKSQSQPMMRKLRVDV